MGHGLCGCRSGIALVQLYHLYDNLFEPLPHCIAVETEYWHHEMVHAVGSELVDQYQSKTIRRKRAYEGVRQNMVCCLLCFVL